MLPDQPLIYIVYGVLEVTFINAFVVLVLPDTATLQRSSEHQQVPTWNEESAGYRLRNSTMSSIALYDDDSIID